MKFCFKLFKVILFLCCLGAPFSLAANEDRQIPALLLANIYQSDIKLKNYWVSEKFDGVRAYWNGANFVSRQGNVFHAPEWFTGALPEMALDGELWLGRGEFERLSGVVRRQSPDDADWSGIKFMVFDLPAHTGFFDERLKRLEEIVADIKTSHIQLVKQFKVSSHEVLMKKLDDIVNQGGEGLMLHLASSVYKNARSDDLLKLKKHFDAEAVVINHLPGKGKYKGMLGSIVVETADKKRFKIGTGFSDAERRNPPAIGSTITYKYFGLTNKGVPRFASFMRVRKYH
jgi:DNA ligase-1